MAFLFGAAAFLGAALLFLVEPMLAKLVLPSFGGSPMVWNTATLFFQVMLLAGYAYVHLSTRWLGGRRQPLLHLALLVAPVLVLPVALPVDAAPPSDGQPALWLLRVLLLAAGLPFALLATIGPMLQRWFASTSHPRAADPYFLFAASNAGSMVGLLGYPFVVEPSIGLGRQLLAWSWAYVGVTVLVGACGVVALRAARRTVDDRVPDVAPTADEPVGWTTRLAWVALAFLPSSLMLGVTTHVTTDIASVPLFWTVPLAVYLATFVVAFGRTTRRAPRVAPRVAAALCVPVLADVLGAWRPAVWVSIALDLALLAAVGLAAHGRLAAARPAVSRLTGFYLLVSLGGAFGGLLNGLAAPVLLDRPLEFPVAVALVPLLALGGARARLPRRWTRLLGRGAPRRGLLAAAARQPLAAVSVLLLTALALQTTAPAGVLRRERTYFGSYRVSQEGDRRVLAHGTTVHGLEVLTGSWARQPTTYYASGGPIGAVMSAYRGSGVLDRVAVVGLGAGTLAAYGRAGQLIDFYEIDPVVADLARSEFGYLRRSGADVRIVLGDARLSLAQGSGGPYGLIVLDAFSSDAIPVHLLTVEAMRDYLQRLEPDGLLAVHVSNRHLDLAPVLAAVGRSLGLQGLVRSDATARPPAYPSTWVVLGRTREDLALLRNRGGWAPVRPEGTRPWTDDYSSLVQVLSVD